jgi:hypothetical protein
MITAVPSGHPCYEVSAGSLGWGKPMSIDWEVAKVWFVVIALIAFNLPIGVASWKFRNVTGLGKVLQEKDAEGDDTGALSYSRVTGLIGAVVVASLFWVMSNETGRERGRDRRSDDIAGYPQRREQAVLRRRGAVPALRVQSAQITHPIGAAHGESSSEAAPDEAKAPYDTEKINGWTRRERGGRFRESRRGRYRPDLARSGSRSAGGVRRQRAMERQGRK